MVPGRQQNWRKPSTWRPVAYPAAPPLWTLTETGVSAGRRGARIRTPEAGGVPRQAGLGSSLGSTHWSNAASLPLFRESTPRFATGLHLAIIRAGPPRGRTRRHRPDRRVRANA